MAKTAKTIVDVVILAGTVLKFSMYYNRYIKKRWDCNAVKFERESKKYYGIPKLLKFH